MKQQHYAQEYFATQLSKSDNKVSWQYGHIFALAGAKPAGRILDVGCGAGPGLRYLRARGAQAVGVDLVYYPLSKAQQAIPGVELVQANVSYVLPFADCRFDIVLLSELIEHLSNGRHLLFDSYRVLRPGGQTIITTPNLWDIRRLLEPITGREWSGNSDPTHVNMYTPTRLADEMISAGYKEVRWRTGVKPALWLSSRKLRMRLPIPYPPLVGNGLLATGVRKD
jgi:2-polyprenyl-3-methyl-5-hydroxy-6-metoxy-1,4-benzoquinol methylase